MKEMSKKIDMILREVASVIELIDDGPVFPPVTTAVIWVEKSYRKSTW